MNQKNLDALNAMQPQSVDDLNLVEVLDVEFGIKSENDNGVIKIIDGSSMPSDAGISTAKANLLAKYQNSFYAKKRGVDYPRIADQLDLLWHDIESGKFGEAAKTGDWYVGISSVKTTFPKPS